jgi:hypothetical protein
MIDRFLETKMQIASEFLGKAGIHGVGISGPESISVHYVKAETLAEQADQGLVILGIQQAAFPYHVQFVECGVPQAL